MIPERSEFQSFLFRLAFCVMACDGNIDDREVKEIRDMNKSSAYFRGVDLSDELEILLAELETKGKHIVDNLFEKLEKFDISTVQELLILEVAFRMVAADKKHDENEIKFIQYLRSKLKVHDEIIRNRFGAVEYLFDKDYSQEVVRKEMRKDLFDSIAMPEFKDLLAVNFSE
ncbi:MAG: hypothetical protein WAW22_04655 [Smithellaceae bacterium]|jgi:uncharacterized tellurite resistance protein B-like protein